MGGMIKRVRRPLPLLAEAAPLPTTTPERVRKAAASGLGDMVDHASRGPARAPRPFADAAPVT
jgi:hypothetical protein